MSDRNNLLHLIDKECLTVGSDFKLSTGTDTKFYFDCKKVTLDGDGLNMAVDLILDEINKLPVKPDAIGGLTLGADPIISGVVLKDPSIKGSIVRKEPKEHGTKNKIENQLPEGTKIVVVDDVITSGSSTKTACMELKNAGYKIVGIIALVDREAGGIESLREEFGHATALFQKSEFPKLMDRLEVDNTVQTAVTC